MTNEPTNTAASEARQSLDYLMMVGTFASTDAMVGNHLGKLRAFIAGVPELVAERDRLKQSVADEREERERRCVEAIRAIARATAAEARVAELEAEGLRFESYLFHLREQLTAAESKLAECGRGAS